MKDFQQAISGNQLTLVDFYATWCGPCQTMHPILEQLKKDLGDDIRILKVNIDQQQRLCTYYSVLSVPTFMLFRNGRALWRHTGTLSLTDLKRAIRDHQ